jgi:hypothetical protein
MTGHQFLLNAQTDLGRDFAILDFSTPYWQGLRDRIHAQTANASSRVLLDNTTVHNAWLLMTEGLGDPTSANALLLQDLSTLFLALTHFDEIVVLQHQPKSPAAAGIASICGAVMTSIDWDSEQMQNEDLSWDLHSKFNEIQNQFFKRSKAIERWSKRWSSLWERDVKPMHFWKGEIDHLIDSPSHPLHYQAAGFESSRLSPNGEAFENKDWLRFHYGLAPQEHASSMASYHTYRAVFYTLLADHLDIPYLPCSTRGFVSDFLRSEFLDQPSDHLNPNLALSLQQLAVAVPDSFARYPPALRLPVLGLQPVLNLVLQRIRSYSTPQAPNWQNIVRELRGESADFREALALFLAGLRDHNQTLSQISRFLEDATTKTAPSNQPLGSSMKIAANLAESYLTLNPSKAFLGLAEAVSTNPFEFFDRWTRRRRVRFLLDAAQLAHESESVEDTCEKIWQRRFSRAESRYLNRMQSLPADS